VADDRLSPAAIRSARPEDLPALVELLPQLREGATPGVTWEPADDRTATGVWEQILSDPRRAFLVAELDDRVVGTADLVIVPNLTHAARPIAYVENVVVDKGLRGRGIGRALMAACETRAVEAGCYKLQLLSNRYRDDAHRFYESLGFEPAALGYRRYLE
jgi:ribosomal protein S18 acetylase RimI-like enzyme